MRIAALVDHFGHFFACNELIERTHGTLGRSQRRPRDVACACLRHRPASPAAVCPTVDPVKFDGIAYGTRIALSGVRLLREEFPAVQFMGRSTGRRRILRVLGIRHQWGTLRRYLGQRSTTWWAKFRSRYVNLPHDLRRYGPQGGQSVWNAAAIILRNCVFGTPLTPVEGDILFPDKCRLSSLSRVSLPWGKGDAAQTLRPFACGCRRDV